MRGLPASELRTELVAQFAYTIESAPQSTINHNAVIEVGSLAVTPERPETAWRRWAHKKKAHPARGGLKSAGPCQNRMPRAIAAAAESGDLGRYLALIPNVGRNR